MNINFFNRAVDLINKNKSMADFEGKKDLELIQKAEKRLNLKFPSSYKEFLRNYGCGDIGGEEFFGLINEKFDGVGIPNAIGITLKFRMEEQLPENLIVFYFDGYEKYYAIDCSKVQENKEGSVVIWDSEASKTKDNLEKVADSFGEFFLMKIQEAVKNHEED